jgi:glycosyltransferase involved in cell wall biosynthesis
MGLLRTDASAARRYWLRILLSGTTLATLSKPEAIWLRQVLGPRVRVVDFAFGVDLEYWQPSPAERGGPVLSVGNDWNRDFATLTACWKPEFPVLEIVTSLPVSSDKANVRVIRGDWRSQIISDDDLRARVRRARLVVVPLRDTIQPSGQSAALQAMACGRPVIMSGNRGCWDREMLERHGACRFVPPGDPSALSDAITGLLADPDAAEAMGVRARRMLERENVSSAGMADQFRALIPALGLRR